MNTKDGGCRKAGKEGITIKGAKLKSEDDEKVGKQAKKTIAKPACPRKKLKAKAEMLQYPAR